MDALSNEWLTTLPIASDRLYPLANLAAALARDHGDYWLTEFLKSRFSSQGNRALASAIAANHEGNAAKALRQATRAASKYREVANVAGALRSQLEVVYALHRQSRAQRCFTYAASSQRARTLKFTWIATQLAVEASACAGMNNSFTMAWHKAQDASAYAVQSHYQNLLLRSIALESALDAAEGRSTQAWKLDQRGLDIFWTGALAPERGFQFYSDMELLAEEATQWSLASSLQREALIWIDQTQRYDFRALAHLHLANVLARTNAFTDAATEIARSQAFLDRLGDSPTRRFYEAISDVTLADIDSSQGAFQSALRRLESSKAEIIATDNFTVRLPYEKIWAKVAARLGNDIEKADHLRAAAAIGDKGYADLKSGKERWTWRKEVGDVYRDLFEIELQRPHTPEESLTRWISYRATETLGPKAISAFGWRSLVKELLRNHMQRVDAISFVTYAALPTKTVAWVADERGIREFSLTSDPTALQHEVRRFYELCRDPSNPEQKVKEEGSRLYQLLLEPFQKELEGRGEILIEADEALGPVVWPALVAASGNFFGREHAILSTIGIFHFAQSNVHTSTRRFLVAKTGAVSIDGNTLSSLPAAEREAEQVSSVYSQTLVMRKDHITSAELKKWLPRVSLFHFAGHAVNREYGGDLVVEDRNGAGDLVSASSLTDLELSGLDLVVLSACSITTGAGANARDPRGLVTGFLKAGAHRVIASRWDVDSAATADLMIVLHRGLRRGLRPAEALRVASTTVSQEPGYSHPYFWASFEEFEPTIVSRYSKNSQH